MRIFTNQEVSDACTVTSNFGCELEHDNHGQMIIYTGIFRWEDGTYRDEPDPTYDEDS